MRQQLQLMARSAWRYGGLGILAIGFLIPLALALSLSLQTMKEAYSDPPPWIPASPQWGQFVEVFDKLPFGRFLFNSTVISVVGSIGAVLTSAMAGYAFARTNWKGRRFWYVLLLLTLMVPGPVLLIPKFLMFESLGWIHSYRPLIVPAWLGGGAFNVLLFMACFRRMGRHLEDAARIDGATEGEVFWRVHLPTARPMVITVGIMSFVYHWNLFLEPLMYLSDFRTYPVSLGLRMYQSLAGTWLPHLMAASLVALVPVMLVVIGFSRHLWPDHRAESGFTMNKMGMD